MNPPALTVVLLVALCSPVLAQRPAPEAIGGTPITRIVPRGPREQVMPLQQLPAIAVGTVGRALARIRMAACSPAQTSAGSAPGSFVLVKSWPSGPEFDWPAVPGAVAYLVERAIDNGAYQWTVAGTTCGSPDAIRSVQYDDGTAHLRFRDIIGGVVPGTQYVYKVSAVGAAAELGWNSTRWTAPSQAVEARSWPPTGSTVQVGYYVACGTDLTQLSGVTRLTEVLVTSSYGFSRAYNSSGTCGGSDYHEVLGVPIGTHTFTANAQWIQTLDPNLPRVIPTFGTSSNSITIVIKP